MNKLLDRYLDRVLVYANNPADEATSIRQELKDHLLQKADDLAAGGMSREEAVYEALRQHGSPKVVGYGLRGPFPWIDIRSHGTARGVIAIGPKAVGVFAFGGVAMGVVACGGVAIGLFSAGGISLGLLFVWAALGIGGVVNAGMAIGIVASGGLVIGLVGDGASGIAAWVPPHGPVGSSPNLIGHYTSANVPSFLKSLEILLNPGAFIDLHWAIIVPSYILAVFGMTYVRYCEGKRVRTEEDWLIDG